MCLNFRQRACAAAVENAHQKARDIGQLLGHMLGPPLLVREEETKEWRNEDEEEAGKSLRVAPLPRHTCMPTVAVSSRVSVTFSLRDRSRKKTMKVSDSGQQRADCHGLKCFIASWIKVRLRFFWLGQHKNYKLRKNYILKKHLCF